MDFFSPAMIALYIILGSFVVAFVYIVIVGDRLTLLRNQASNPDRFSDKKDDDMEVKEETQKAPVYPQTVEITGYVMKPQPHSMDVSNELVETTVRKVCGIDSDCCSL